MTKDISVIIVNYNVKYFLRQCLLSVYKAKADLDIEVIVVDNNSIDESVSMVEKEFPDVILIANKENLGFAKANNQAIQVSNGKYILLLNPDTIIEEKTLVKIYDYMENHPDTGALGVKLIDGEGRFLPESKRGFPTLTASFFRLSGLSKLFPSSKIFNQYNLGFLPEDKISEVDVLCGAFMFMPRRVLDETGLLDEDFFMYGEDIDLSFRIKQAGYKIVYYPETTVVHFKGESTKKSTLKYHNIFYKAMSIFAKKHYGKGILNPMLWMINIAVFLFATANYIKVLLGRWWIAILDFVLFGTVLYAVQSFWARYHFGNPDYYDMKKTFWLFLLFSLIWVAGIYFNGGYDKNRIVKAIKGVTVSTVIILVIYSLLPESIRYSRAIILLGSVLSLFVLILSRFILRLLLPSYFNKSGSIKKVIIAGSEEEVDRVRRIMDINGVQYKYEGSVIPQNATMNEKRGTVLGKSENLDKVIDIYRPDEIIFCLKDFEIGEVMRYMSRVGAKVKIKVVPEGSFSIVGSSARNSRGEFYSMELNYKLANPSIKRVKYTLDFFIAVFVLILYPLIKMINPSFRFSQVLAVLKGEKTWISYVDGDSELSQLPVLRPGVFEPVFKKHKLNIKDNYLHDINVMYAYNYSVWLDLEYLFKHILIAN